MFFSDMCYFAFGDISSQPRSLQAFHSTHSLSPKQAGAQFLMTEFYDGFCVCQCDG